MQIKNRIVYAALFILSLSFIYFYGGKVPYTLFNVILVLPLISLLYTVVIYFRFKYSQELDKKFLIKGDKVNFLFKINNEDLFLYPYISVTFCGADTIFTRQFQTKNFSLLPFASKVFSFELECKYRGTYELGIKSVEIEDFLGIFKLSYKTLENKFINVFPRIIKLDNFQLRTNYLSDSQPILNNRNEDLAVISDIRKYSYGDSLKKIHWKLTAKMNEILVKNYQSTSETNAVLILDLQKGDFSVEESTIIEDKLIETTVSILHYCLTNWVNINLVFYSEKINSFMAKNPLDFDEMYNILARVKFSDGIAVKDIIDVYMNDTINSTNIVVFTSNINYELFNQLYKTRFSGHDVSLIYVSPDDATGKISEEANSILSFLPEIDVNAYRININDDIKLVLER